MFRRTARHGIRTQKRKISIKRQRHVRIHQISMGCFQSSHQDGAFTTYDPFSNRNLPASARVGAGINVYPGRRTGNEIDKSTFKNSDILQVHEALLSMDKSQSSFKLSVLVPKDVVPGQTIHVKSPNGQTSAVIIPPGALPGTEIIVEIDPSK